MTRLEKCLLLVFQLNLIYFPLATTYFFHKECNLVSWAKSFFPRSGELNLHTLSQPSRGCSMPIHWGDEYIPVCGTEKVDED